MWVYVCVWDPKRCQNDLSNRFWVRFGPQNGLQNRFWISFGIHCEAETDSSTEAEPCKLCQKFNGRTSCMPGRILLPFRDPFCLQKLTFCKGHPLKTIRRRGSLKMTFKSPADPIFVQTAAYILVDEEI